MRTAIKSQIWRIISLMLFVAFFCPFADCKTIYVDDDAVGNNDGTSWENAYVYLQDALADAAGTNNSMVWGNASIYLQDSLADTKDSEKSVDIRVAQGVYTPDRGKNQSTGDRWATFQLINEVTLMGGFAGLGATDPNTRNISLYETILSGDLNVDDGALLNSNIENSYHVVTGSRTDVTAVMNGFTIRDGNANRRCYPDFAGGGMFLDSSSPTVAYCSFIANEGLDGGGMSNDNDSNPNLINCTFDGNLSDWGGGMANVHGSSPTLTNCLFIRNHATNDGGGMYNGKEGNVMLINCTFSGNSARRGGAMQCDYCSSIRLANTILWNDGPDEISLLQSSVTVTYSDIQGGWPGVGNIDIDPLFADPYNDDFHIKSQAGRWDKFSESWVIDDVTSPCIDAGDPNSSVAFEPFPNGVIINMGVYGNTTEASKSPSGLHPKYGGGTGEPNDPYLIYTAEQMNQIGSNPEDWSKHFKLMADIDLNTYTNDQFNIIGGSPAFTGVFDGNHHVISNFSYTSPDKDCIGLFGYVYRFSGEQAEIKNLGLIDPNINAGTGDYVGSLIGWLDAGTITGCYVEGGNVVGDEYIGGLVGAHGHRIPGLDPSVIPTPDYTISYCYSTSRVKGTIYIGGMVGFNIGQITNCYSMGSVFGNDIVGGLVGQDGDWGLDPTWGGKMLNSYSTSHVVGQSNTGGLVGLNVRGMIINNCFWDIQSSGWTTSNGGTGKTTAEMQTANTFLNAGWDFIDESDNGTNDIWWIDEGQDYPRLWWEAE